MTLIIPYHRYMWKWIQIKHIKFNRRLKFNLKNNSCPRMKRTMLLSRSRILLKGVIQAETRSLGRAPSRPACKKSRVECPATPSFHKSKKKVNLLQSFNLKSVRKGTKQTRTTRKQQLNPMTKNYRRRLLRILWQGRSSLFRSLQLISSDLN